MITIRATIATSANKGWKVHQLDIITSFLNRDLEEEVYVTQTLGFVIKGVDTKVCQLLIAQPWHKHWQTTKRVFRLPQRHHGFQPLLWRRQFIYINSLH